MTSCGFSQSTVVDQTVQLSQSDILYQTATIDRFGNLYYANINHQVLKFDPRGRQVGFYSNDRYGNVGLIDASNPLKILLYYPDFYTGILLDRQLHETHVFDMIDLGYGEIELVAASRDGELWIFNDHEQRLNKVNPLGQVLQKGEDLRLRFNERLSPSKILQLGSEVYIILPQRGVIIFDLFGQFKSQILQSQIKDIHVTSGHLILSYGDVLEVYDPTSLQNQLIELEEQKSESRAILHKDVIIFISKLGIEREVLTKY